MSTGTSRGRTTAPRDISEGILRRHGPTGTIEEPASRRSPILLVIALDSNILSWLTCWSDEAQTRCDALAPSMARMVERAQSGLCFQRERETSSMKNCR